MKHALPLAALLLLCTPALAQPAGATSPAGVAAWNAELQSVYDRLLPALKRELDAQGRAQLTALDHRSSWLEARVSGVRSLHLGIDTAPGLQRLTPSDLDVVVPRQGTWTLEAEVEVTVRVKLIFTWATFRLPPVRVIVDRVRVSAHAGIDSSDPLRPTVARIDPPQVDFRVRLRSPNWLFDVLLRLLSPVGNWFAQRAARDALAQLQPALGAFAAGLPGPIPGDGAPLLTDSGRQVPFGEIARNVDRKIRRDHLPYGTLLMADMDVPAHDSWEDAYRNGGPGNPGTARVHGDGGDSAIFTGMYLGSQALRYARTGESEALDNVGWVLDGIGNLLAVNGDTGLLARVTAPEATPFGQTIVSHGAHGRATIQGQTWVGLQGGGGISRDQYIGVWFGLILTYDLVPIPGVRAECSRLLQMMLDYFIAKDWIIDEDRPAFDVAAGRGFPTFWFGIASQKIHYLLMGTRLDAQKYGAHLQAASPLAATHWLGAWTAVFNLSSYYKFNLSHLTYYNHFRLETDPTRWQDLARGFHITRRYVFHHKNPHFNLVQASVDPSLAATYHPAALEALRQFVTRNHRRVAPPVVDLSGVTWVTITQPTLTLPGQNPQPTQITLPSEPLDVDLRAPTGDFLWQRDPFGPATPGAGNPLVEKNGLDLVLPYWMGHQQGVW